jgi:hypothetical protein
MATLADTFHRVAAPAGTPYRFGLFSVLSFEPDERSGIGVAWQSQGCHTVLATEDSCINPAVAPLVPDGYCSVIEVNPITVYVLNDDSLAGIPLAEHEQAARDRLAIGEQTAVESVVSAAALAAASPIASALGDSPAEKALCALGVVEQELAALTGAEGIIHMSRFAASLLPLDKTGSMLRTQLGTPVAAYGGWDGYTPGAAPSAVTILGTGPAKAYRGAVETYSGAPALDSNDASVLAERTYTIGFDCGVVGATATL